MYVKYATLDSALIKWPPLLIDRKEYGETLSAKTRFKIKGGTMKFENDDI